MKQSDAISLRVLPRVLPPPAAWAGCGWARGNGAMMQCYDAMVTWPLNMALGAAWGQHRACLPRPSIPQTRGVREEQGQQERGQKEQGQRGGHTTGMKQAAASLSRPGCPGGYLRVQIAACANSRVHAGSAPTPACRVLPSARRKSAVTEKSPYLVFGLPRAASRYALYWRVGPGRCCRCCTCCTRTSCTRTCWRGVLHDAAEDTRGAAGTRRLCSRGCPCLRAWWPQYPVP